MINYYANMKDIKDIRKELDGRGFTKEKIENYLELVRYIYIGQNIRNEGILQDEDELTKNKEVIDLLLKDNIISSHKWYQLDLFKLTNLGLEIGEILIKEKLDKKKELIKKELDDYPQLLIGFLVHNYLSKELSFYLEEEGLWDWRDLILRDSRVKRVIKKIFEKFIDLKLCIIAHDYVSTRGGEKRGERHVISPEIRRVLLNFYQLDGLTSNDKIKRKVYYLLIEKIRYIEKGAQCPISGEELRKIGSFNFTYAILKDILDNLEKDGIIKNLIYDSAGKTLFTIVKENKMEAEISFLSETQIAKLLGPEEIFGEIEEEGREGFDIEYNQKIMRELIENKVQLYRLIAQLSHGKSMFTSNPNTELYGLNLIEPLHDENELKNFIVNLHQFVIECSASKILRFIDSEDFWNSRKESSFEISPKEFMDLVEEIDDDKKELYQEAKDMLNNLHNLRNHYSHLQNAQRLYKSSVIFKKLINMSFPTTDEEIEKVHVFLLEKIRDALHNLCEVFTTVLSKKK